MKTYRNIEEIQSKEQRGRRLSMFGLGILMIGLLASFVPTWIPSPEAADTPLKEFLATYWTWISFVALPIGFILASFGSYYINRFARRRWKGSKTFARPDEMLERSLKGFDNKYAYFAWSLPAHYMIVGPCGILLIAARSDKGRVVVNGDKWREPFSLSRIFTFFAREGLGNPAKEINEQTTQISNILATCDSTQSSKGDDGPSTIPITGAAVFLNPEVNLSVENPSMPVIRADQLKEFVRRQAREVKLPANVVREMTDCLVHTAAYSDEEV